jgi:hypothetical protein
MSSVQENVIAKEYFRANLKVGDIIFYGDLRRQVYAYFPNCQGHCESLVEIQQPGYKDSNFIGKHNFDPGPGIKTITPKKVAEFTYATALFQSIPIGHSSTIIKKSDVGVTQVYVFLSGSEESFKRYYDKFYSRIPRIILLNNAAVTSGQLCIPPMKPGVSKFTKRQLVAYVIDVNGNINYRQICQKVAELQGKLWSEGSVKYFKDSDFTQISAKRPRTKAWYTLKPAGIKAAQLVKNKLGEELGRV